MRSNNNDSVTTPSPDGDASLPNSKHETSAGELARQKELLDLTGKLAKVGGWEVDLESMKLSWTLETFRIVELEPPIEPTLEQWINLFAPEARPTISSAVQSAIESGRSYDLALPLITAKGRHLWVQTQGHAETRNGKPLRIFGTFQDITELRANEQRLTHALAATNEGVWDWNLSTDEVYFSPQWYRLLGLEPAHEPARVELFLNIVHPDDMPAVKRELDDHLSGKKDIKETEARLRMKSGEYRWFLDRGKVVERDDDGQPARMVGTITDITARKAAEEALHKSEARSHLLVRAANVALWDWDLVTETLYLSPEWKGQLGYADDELSSSYEEWESRLHPEDRESTLAAVANCKAERSSCAVEFRLRHRDGSWRWIFTQAEVTRDTSGRAIRMVGSSIDITERKQAEIALRKSESRLREAQRIARIGNWELDLADNHLYWSDVIFHIFEIDQTKFGATYEAFLNVVHPDDREKVNDAYFASLHDRKPYQIVHRLLMPDGRIKFVEEQCETDFTADGTALQSRGTVQDVTEQKLAEKALKESEVRWKFAIEGSGDGIWDWNIPMSKVFLTSRWKSMFGFSDGEIGDTPDEWSKRVHPEDLEATMATIEEHLDGTTPHYVNEHRVQCKDGSWKWTLSRGMVVERDAEGNPVRMIGTQSDISERKQAEEALRASEVHTRQILDGLYGFVGVCTLDGTLIDANDASLQVAGLRREDVLGRPFWDTHYWNRDPEAQAKLKTSLARAALGEVVRYEAVVQVRDGALITTDGTIGPMRNANGEITHILAFAVDITERKQAEEALRENEVHTRQILDGLFGFVGVCTLDGTLIDARPMTIATPFKPRPTNCP